jgi:hypothetical protein
MGVLSAKSSRMAVPPLRRGPPFGDRRTRVETPDLYHAGGGFHPPFSASSRRATISRSSARETT